MYIGDAVYHGMSTYDYIIRQREKDEEMARDRSLSRSLNEDLEENIVASSKASKVSLSLSLSLAGLEMNSHFWSPQTDTCVCCEFP